MGYKPNSLLTDGMVWSYSRLKCYEQCPYKFFLRYILGMNEAPSFYESCGSLVHELLADFYKGKDDITGISRRFALDFTSRAGIAPGAGSGNDYYSQCIEALQHPWIPDGDIISVERYVRFDLDGLPFQGFIDLMYRSDGMVVIADHKSHALKKFSGRKKPTISDMELKSYLRQPALYAEGIRQTYGELPGRLVFNCYRTGNVIDVPCTEEIVSEAKEWALGIVGRIESDNIWGALPDWFFCKRLCGFMGECEWSGQA